MQYLSIATLAFALGASARPQFPGGWNPPPFGSFQLPGPSGGPEPSGAPIPSGVSSGVAAPSGGSSLPAPIPSSAPYYPIGNSSIPSGPSGTSAPSFSSVDIPSGSGSSVEAPSAVASSVEAPSGVASSVGAASGAASSGAAVTSSPASSGSASSGGSLPASSGTSALDATQTIAAGDSFDCGMVMYDRGVDCTGQEEGGDSDAVFILENGASLSNCIIGPNQIEGVHCEGACSLNNVWWSAVCEDAFTIKEQDSSETTTISGGGAFGAEDKVLQHNGGGTLSVTGFTVDNFGKVYRSCGNCDEMFERHVIMDDVTATGGSEIAGINSNYGDTATLSNIKVSDVDDICVTYTGNDTGDEPEENGSGPSDYCLYSESDITEI